SAIRRPRVRPGVHGRRAHPPAARRAAGGDDGDRALLASLRHVRRVLRSRAYRGRVPRPDRRLVQAGLRRPVPAAPPGSRAAQAAVPLEGRGLGRRDVLDVREGRGMRRVVVVQARMTSTRLPGKVRADVAGRPMLAQRLRGLAACRLADELVVATTLNATDDPVVAVARGEGARWFRGSQADVLERYVGAAREARADVVVRITADCPLIDPDVSDRVVATLADAPARWDYVSNVAPRTFPRGLDTEALFVDTLERVHRMARSHAAREHVTPFIYQERPDLFALGSVTDREDNSDLRWTVDTPADLELVRRLYAALGVGERAVGYRELLAYARAHPELSALNAPIASRGGEEQ